MDIVGNSAGSGDVRMDPLSVFWPDILQGI